MKLSIKKKYFDQIKSGKKQVEYRDAHITFVCEETGEELKKDIFFVQMMNRTGLPKELRDRNLHLFSDEILLKFDLRNSA